MKPWPFQWYTDTAKVSASLNDHHPVFDTLIFALFYKIGLLLKSQEAGLFLYVLCQIAATAFAFSFMLCFMEHLGVPEKLRRVGFFFLAFAPFICLYAITMVKDSLYGFLFVFYMVIYCSVVFSGGDRRKWIALGLLSLLLALTKKTGVYLVVLCDLALLLDADIRKNARNIRHILICALLPAFVIFILMGKILFPLFDVYPGGKQEAIGICLQQVARAVIEHPGEISEEDREIIDAVIDYESIEARYSPALQDGIKRIFRFDAAGRDIMRFLMLWLRWLPRCPGSYLKAWTECVGGYFAPVREIVTYFSTTKRNIITWKNPPETETHRIRIQEVYASLVTIPGLSILMQSVLYIWWLPLLSFFTCLTKARCRWKRLLCLLPVILSVGILTLCPYAGFRYALSQVYVLPLIMGLPFMQGNRLGKRQSGNVLRMRTGEHLLPNDRFFKSMLSGRGFVLFAVGIIKCSVTAEAAAVAGYYYKDGHET